MDRAALDALLAAHLPADDVEAGHVATVRRALAGDADPFARDTFTPGHVTASAFVLDPARGRLLLIWHGKLHRWLQPGGHVDPTDADVLAAARREVAEETGLTDLAPGPGFPAVLDVDVHAIPPNPKRGEPAHLHLDVRVALIAGDTAAVAGDDALDVRWVALDDVAALDTDESVLRAVRRLRAALTAQDAP